MSNGEGPKFGHRLINHPGKGQLGDWLAGSGDPEPDDGLELNGIHVSVAARDDLDQDVIRAPA